MAKQKIGFQEVKEEVKNEVFSPVINFDTASGGDVSVDVTMYRSVEIVKETTEDKKTGKKESKYSAIFTANSNGASATYNLKSNYTANAVRDEFKKKKEQAYCACKK